MAGLLAQLLPTIVGLLITPGAVIGAILLLRSGRPIPNATMFGAGFLAVYAFVALSAILGGASDPASTSENVSHGTGLVIGILFLLIGGWLALRAPRPATERPRLLRELDNAGSQKSFVIGVTLGALNPNLFIMLAGLATISSSTAGPAAALLAVGLLLLAAVGDIAIPIAIYAATGERAARTLDSWQDWLLRHSRALTLAVLFGFGALFTIRGAIDLAG